MSKKDSKMSKEEFILRLKQVGTDFKKKGITICYTKLPSDVIENMDQFGGIPFIKKTLSKKTTQYLLKPLSNSLMRRENIVREYRRIEKILAKREDPARRKMTKSNIEGVSGGYNFINYASRYHHGLNGVKKLIGSKPSQKIGKESLKHDENFIPTYFRVFMKLGRHPSCPEFYKLKTLSVRVAAYKYHTQGGGIKAVRHKINQYLMVKGEYDMLLKTRVIDHLKRLRQFVKKKNQFNLVGKTKLIFPIILTPFQIKELEKLAKLLSQISRRRITLRILKKEDKIIYLVDKEIDSSKAVHQLTEIEKRIKKKRGFKLFR